ncbi:MAG: 50S ribosomal protein L11 methyltransferase [Verrucomicrobia bacterium]|nr:MAG: 50S ribosomal protein L11 methyltransferase [Verrucomicrobiota bacterium]
MSAAIWKISVATTSEAEEVVSELLGRIFATTASGYINSKTGATRVSVYSPKQPAGLKSKLASLRDGLSELRSCGLNVGSGRFSIRQMQRENWAESWKRHFPPLEFGKALLVKPSWSRRKPRQGQSVIVLDPGLSFGTGKHPTTEFCLRQIVANRKPGTEQSFLDIGTGSGILAIAAVKLGYAPVHAFDFDPAAVRIARQNTATNRVARKVKLYRDDVTALPMRSGKKYSLVCANLLANLLMAERKRIIARLAPGGKLVIAGILKTEFAAVQKSFEECGLRLIASSGKREWRSGTFSRG